jgi:hypothetical protein
MGGIWIRIIAVMFISVLAISVLSCSQESRMKTSKSGNALPETAAWMKSASAKLESELAARYGESQRLRAQRGLQQIAEFWRAPDGDQAVFTEFVNRNFAGDKTALDTMFSRFQYLFEQAFGHMTEINREFRQQMDLDAGPIQPYDEFFAGYDSSAHLIDDFFNNKLAFAVLLNFPLTTLNERLANGDKWTRREWAETRLAEYFSKRIPAEVNLAVAKVSAESSQYIAEYNIWMHHLIDGQGQRLSRRRCVCCLIGTCVMKSRRTTAMPKTALPSSA